MQRRRLPWILAIGLGAVLAAWWGCWAASVRWYRAALGEAKREFESGRFADARARLLALEARWPGQAEVAYQLGLCEQLLGRLDEAMAAWARVPAGSLYSERAALHRAKGR